MFNAPAEQPYNRSLNEEKALADLRNLGRSLVFGPNEWGSNAHIDFAAIHEAIGTTREYIFPRQVRCALAL